LLDLLFSLIIGIFSASPSRSLYKKYKLLQKETMYMQLLNKYGTMLQMNSAVRAFIKETDVNKILADHVQKLHFHRELEKIILAENL